LVARVLCGGDKIWTWSGSSFWCTKKIKNVSVGSREEFQNNKKRKRWSEFTENFAGVHRHLRIDELECGQPGGGSARVLGGGGVREGGVLIGMRRRRNRNRIARINSG
jgi:hypothetical protein